MDKVRRDKIVAFIEKKRAEGKFNMDVMLSLIDEVDRKAREETFSESIGAIVDLQRGVSNGDV
jgi:hypothetical protein